MRSSQSSRWEGEGKQVEGKQLPLEGTTQMCLPNLWSLFHGDNLVQQPNLAAREAGPTVSYQTEKCPVRTQGLRLQGVSSNNSPALSGCRLGVLHI